MIVFSAKGDRPDMEKMAGADLDGDVYWVSWDKDFLKYFHESAPAPSKAKNIQIVGENEKEEEDKVEVNYENNWLDNENEIHQMPDDDIIVNRE